MNKYIYLFLIALLPTVASAQTFTDGLMMQKGSFCTGAMYMNDQWEKYWEGELNRTNGNIGKITTQSVTWIGTYGITDKINVLVTVPYVWTKASQGTLRGLEGIQDLSIGVKYNFFSQEFGGSKLKAFGVLSYTTPLTDYTPDFLPLSIGMASKKLTYRLNAYYRLSSGWFANASAGYVWRSNVTMDRPSHYYDGHLVNSTEAYLPNMFDLFVSAGYVKGPIQAELNYMSMNTLGGDDIGRQAMPEVGNQMDASRVGATVMYYVPLIALKGLAVRGGWAYTFNGRNVGQSTTYMAGLLYTIHFKKTAEEQPIQ